ncbi:hypothetical protein BDZ89DRAFT_1116970 [Hymenopellis radicata]|nr:hypothetical protein BDZ89DRAFT_1116970 [Hymenopellis radicata]
MQLSKGKSRHYRPFQQVQHVENACQRHPDNAHLLLPRPLLEPRPGIDYVVLPREQRRAADTADISPATAENKADRKIAGAKRVAKAQEKTAQNEEEHEAAKGDNSTEPAKREDDGGVGQDEGAMCTGA